jgi:cytoskeletal protein RodZ
MQPWKMFIRSVSVVTLLTAGGFAAGQAVVPFANVSRGTSPTVEEPAPEEETPAVDPAEEAPETDDSTTTTTEPEATDDDAPSTDDPAEEAPEVAEEPTTTTTAPEVIEVNVAPPAPVADPAPKAKKAKKDKKTKAHDHNCDGHPDNGWLNKDPKYDYRPGRCTPPAVSAPAPAAAPAPASADDNNGRSDAARQDGPGRSVEAKQDGPNGRSTSAPGRMGKSL